MSFSIQEFYPTWVYRQLLEQGTLSQLGMLGPSLIFTDDDEKCHPLSGHTNDLPNALTAIINARRTMTVLIMFLTYKYSDEKQRNASQCS